MSRSTYRDRVVAAGSRLRGTLPVAVLFDLGRANVTDRAMTLAGQAFTSILPVMLLITTVRGHGVIDRTLDRIGTQWLDLNPDPAVATGAQTYSFGVFGALMTLIGATSFSRALDRIYAETWQTPKLGVAGWWRWPLVIAAILVGVTAEVFVVRVAGDAAPAVLTEVAETLLSFGVWTLVWASVTRLLTAGRRTAAEVLWTGAAAGAAVALFLLATQFGFNTILAGAEAQFGTLGVVFTVIGWLFVYAWVMVAAVVAAHTILVSRRATSAPPAARPAD